MNLPIEFEKKMKDFLGDEWEEFLYSYDNNRFQALRFTSSWARTPAPTFAPQPLTASNTARTAGSVLPADRQRSA